MNNGWPVRKLFGLPIHALTMEEVLSIVDDQIKRREALLIGVVNAAKMVNMRQDQVLDQAVRQADLTLADGMSVVWASRLLGLALPERVTGIDLMIRLLERGHQRGYRIYCLGAEPDVLETATNRISRDYPGVRLVGSHHGYYTDEEEASVAKEIAAAEPDMLFVAMSSPKKEQFLARWSKQMQVPVCHGVGGAFDVLAGKVKRAPALWQKAGLEWLYRIFQEPRRMWRRYLVTNASFAYMLIAELVGRLRKRQTRQIHFR